MTRLILWLNGWRRDLDGFLVRAKRSRDNLVFVKAVDGIVEECAIGVRDPLHAWLLDKCPLPKLAPEGDHDDH